ncbi:MAG TPA: UMP kinase [Opitutales bacterium]|nr:UMP kinase [Opitutales bacterium]
MAEGSVTPGSVKYKRVIIKLSGEVLRNERDGEPIDAEILESMCAEIAEIYELGVEIGLVIGGGNIFRGIQGLRGALVQRATGDYMGMMATVINSLALMDTLEKMGVVVRVMSAIPIDRVSEPFILRRAVRHLEKGRLVIFAAGTGNPYFSTDTAAALRGSEVNANLIIKATKVDGVYDKDPMKHTDARKYNEISYYDVIRQRLSVMDTTAFSLCMDNKIPIIVLSLREKGNMRKAIEGQMIGTVVHG